MFLTGVLLASFIVLAGMLVGAQSSAPVESLFKVAVPKVSPPSTQTNSTS
jgi:hypothetical protein